MNGQLTMWSRARAAIGIVTESVDVHSTLGIGIVARNAP